MGGVNIPDKLYFKIGEVSKLTEIEPHVLRYWESEFKSIRPHRAGSRQRLYRKADVETILHIKKLLYDEGFTIAGAKKALTRPAPEAAEAGGRRKSAPAVDRTILQQIKSELKDLKRMLEE